VSVMCDRGCSWLSSGLPGPSILALPSSALAVARGVMKKVGPDQGLAMLVGGHSEKYPT
jgi:hypothetical protein